MDAGCWLLIADCWIHIYVTCVSVEEHAFPTVAYHASEELLLNVFIYRCILNVPFFFMLKKLDLCHADLGLLDTNKSDVLDAYAQCT